MNHTSPWIRNCARLLLTAILLPSIAVLQPEAAGAGAGFTPPDCGANSLYLLLRLTDHSVELEDVVRVLPPRHEHGYSMLELQEAARKRGLRLRGYRLTTENVPLKRPVIAYLDTHKPESGHFVVLVPAGTLGTLVQVVDPPYAPRLVEYGSLLRSNPNISILYPSRFWEISILGLLVTVMILAFVAFITVKLVGRRSIPDNDQGSRF